MSSLDLVCPFSWGVVACLIELDYLKEYSVDFVPFEYWPRPSWIASHLMVMVSKIACFLDWRSSSLVVAYVFQIVSSLKFLASWAKVVLLLSAFTFDGKSDQKSFRLFLHLYPRGNSDLKVAY